MSLALQAAQALATTAHEGQMYGDQLREVYRDGKLLIDDSFATIRERIQSTK